MSDAPRRPRAFRVDAPDVVVAPEGASTRFGTRTVIVPGVEPIAEPPVEAALPKEPRALPWRAMLLAGLGGLVSLALGLAIDRLLADLWARADWLGWVGVGFLALAALALAGLVTRELIGLARLARVEHLRERAAAIVAADDRRAAPALVDAVDALYADLADLARARAALAAHRAEVVEGRDLLALTERELMGSLDAAARTLILEAAKRVSVVTAISPRALVDIAYVAFETLRLMRRLADLYGGRPGNLGFLKLLGRVFVHLGVTGCMAIGDTLVQQLVGQGLAARLSAKLGEGVVNGLLTARLGLAALDVVRPLPWTTLPRPAFSDMMSELTRSAIPGRGDGG